MGILPTASLRALAPGAERLGRHGEGTTYPLVVLTSARTGNYCWAHHLGSPTWRVLVGAREEAATTALRATEDIILLTGLYITRNLLPSEQRLAATEKFTRAVVPLTPSSRGKPQAKRQLIWSNGEGWASDTWADVLGRLLSTWARRHRQDKDDTSNGHPNTPLVRSMLREFQEAEDDGISQAVFGFEAMEPAGSDRDWGFARHVAINSAAHQ
ncbi:hypothetical protein N9L68_04885 [bacterium]|nr:hypothetical protein [bacterium]